MTTAMLIRTRAATLAAGSAVAAGWLLTVRPPTVTTAAADQAIVAAAGWLGWALAGYLLFGVAVTAAGLAVQPTVRRRLPMVLAPKRIRQLVEALAGAGLATVVAVGPASVALADGAPSGPVLSLDWPGVSTPASVTTGIRPANRSVVVRPGDSLWQIAARGLGPHASREAVAAAWPDWWQTNRAVIGHDPDDLEPGERLVPPARMPRSPR